MGHIRSTAIPSRLFSALFIILLLCCRPLSAETLKIGSPAPSLVNGSEWLNVDHAPVASDLQGRVILLDFWTYCCVNCLHVIPELRALEEQFGSQLSVIGIHSAKFDNEKDSSHVRDAVIRYDIRHPVINDGSFALAEAYALDAWPMFVLIGANGKIAGRWIGEDEFPAIRKAIAQEVATGPPAPPPLAMAFEKDKRPQEFLSFPGKILADSKNDRLYISDSGHNRIVVSTLSGSVVSVFGDGSSGYLDGAATQAQFRNPQGLALQGAELFVADTGNHRIRKIDLTAGLVSTIAGSGRKGLLRRVISDAKTAELNSPWDLAIQNNHVLIAMAGSQQIWRLNLSTGKIESWIGNGREGLRDGTFDSSELAQPSGLAVSGEELIVADSESSAIRIASQGKIRTLIGEGLFHFGDKDGQLSRALLQHPLGVAATPEYIYVADSFNHRIKRIDRASQKIVSIAGSGTATAGTGLSEPGGLSLDQDILFIADTNNDRVVKFDLRKGQLSTVLVGERVVREEKPVPPKEFLPNLTELTLAPSEVREEVELQVHLDLHFEENFHLNPDAPSRVTLAIDGEPVPPVSKRPAGSGATWNVELPQGLADFDLLIKATLYFCRQDSQGVCKIKSFRVRKPVHRSNSAAARSVDIPLTLGPNS